MSRATRLPVFVSSTFRDMDYERDLVNRVVMPTVNAELAAKGYDAEVFAVDLRWGIDVDDTLSRAARERMTLEVCVNEVRRCHPLFVGLLGARYGSIAAPDVERVARASAGLRDVGYPLSVMALEMLTAAASSDPVRPVLLARMIRDDNHGAAGAHDRGSRTRDDDLLARLKSQLREAGQTIRSYTSHWRPLTGPEGGMRLESIEFVTVLVEELLDRISKLLVLRPVQSWLETELRAHNSAAADQAEAFVGRGKDMELVAGFWTSPDPLFHAGDSDQNPLGTLRKRNGRQTLAVVGPAGVGKSSLLAWAAVSLQGSLGFGRRAYVQGGLTALSRRPSVCLLVLLAQLDPGAAARIAAAIDPEALQMTDVRPTWCEALVAQPRAPLVILDGLDRLEGPGAPESTRLEWMPLELGGRARFLVSTVDVPVLIDVLRVRPSTYVHWLAPLAPSEVADLVRQRVAAHHRRLPEPVVAALCSIPRLPRWVVVATDLLLKLMAHDYLVVGQPQARDVEPHEAIAAMLEATCVDLPEDLEKLHYEALTRLMRLSDAVAPVLFVFRASMIGGLRTDDVLATLELLEQRLVPADVALVRALLSEHIAVEHEEWSHRHESAAGGLIQMFEDAADESWLEAVAIYRRALCTHLAGLTLDDPVRVRLLALLLWEEDPIVLVQALDRPDVIPDAGVAMLLMWLGWVIRGSDGGAAARMAGELLDSGESDRELLTAADVVIGSFLPALGASATADVAALCRSKLSDIDPATRNRFGQSSAELTQVLDFATIDPAAGGVVMSVIEEVQAWQQRFLADASMLRDAPSYVESGAEMGPYVVFDLTVVIEAAVAVAVGGAEQRREDADEAKSRIAGVRAHFGRLGERARYGPAVEFMELGVMTAVRAASLAWPEGGFVPDPTDLIRVRDLVDRQRGEPGCAVLLAWLSRTWAWQELLDEDASADEAHGIGAEHRALQILEHAIWELLAFRTLVPDALTVEAEWIRCEMLYIMLLEQSDQAASACRSGQRVCVAPAAPTLLGSEAYRELAAKTLVKWVKHDIADVDGAAVIEHLRADLDGALPPGTEAFDEDLKMYEEWLLWSAVFAGQRHARLDVTLAVAERALTLQQDGRLVVDDEPVEDIVRELACELEDDLVEFAESIVDGKLVAEADSAAAADRAAGVKALRTMLTARTRPLREDVIGIVFCAALSAQLLRTAQPLHDTALLRDDVRVRATGVHRERRLLLAVDHVVASFRDRRDADDRPATNR